MVKLIENRREEHHAERQQAHPCGHDPIGSKGKTDAVPESLLRIGESEDDPRCQDRATKSLPKPSHGINLITSTVEGNI